MTDITLKDAEPPPGNKRKHGKGASKTQETPKKKVTAPVLRGPGGRFLSSGNPNGRPAAALEVRELAREHGPEAIARLVHWMRSGCAQDSIAATKILLDRGYGKSMTLLATPNGAPLVNITMGQPITDPVEQQRVLLEILGDPSRDLSAITFAAPAPLPSATLEHAPAPVDVRAAPIESDVGSKWGRLADD